MAVGEGIAPNTGIRRKLVDRGRRLVDLARGSSGHRVLPVVLCPIVAAIAAYTYSSVLTPTYRTGGEFAIQLTHAGVKRGFTSSALAASWAAGIPEISGFWGRAAHLIHRSGDELRQTVVFRAVPGSGDISVTAETSNGADAANFAQAAETQFIGEISQWRGHPARTAVVQAVSVPGSPANPDVEANTAAGAVLGLMIGLVWFLLHRGERSPRLRKQRS